MEASNLLSLLKAVDNYAGESSDELDNFIKKVDLLYADASNSNDASRHIFDTHVREKIKDKANKTLNEHGNPIEWPKIKFVLQNNSSIDETFKRLMDRIELSNIEGSDKKLFENTSHLLSKLHEMFEIVSTDELSSYNRERIEKMELRDFVNKLPDEHKNILQSRNPKTIKEAEQILKETENFDQIFNTNLNTNNYVSMRNQNSLNNANNNNQNDSRLNRKKNSESSNITKEKISSKEKLHEIIKVEHVNRNHCGINRVYIEMRERYIYTNLQKEIIEFINNCDGCNHTKRKGHLKTEKYFHEIVHMGIWSPQQDKMYLTFIDEFSKHVSVHKLKHRNSKAIVTAIRERIQFFGKLNQLITDTDSSDIYSEVEQFLKEKNIKFQKTTASEKTGNDDIKQLHTTLNELLRQKNLKEDTSELDDEIYAIIHNYNNTKHTTTNLKPNDCLTRNFKKDDINRQDPKDAK